MQHGPEEHLQKRQHVWLEKQQEYLQLDAGEVILFKGVASQGRKGTMEFVKSYAISTSTDGLSWTEYHENGKLHLFQDDRLDSGPDHVHINYLPVGLAVRYVRIFPKRWNVWMSMRAGLVGCYNGAKVKMPHAPALLFDNGHTRVLKACYATRRTGGNNWDEYTALANNVLVIPEPTDPTAIIEVVKGEIWSIPWVLTGHSSQAHEGDFLVLQKHNCDNIMVSEVSVPSGPTGVIVLSSEGTIVQSSTVSSRINELNIGTYRLCMATKESLGDNHTDYMALSASIRAFDDATYVTLSSPHVVGLGQDIVVDWSLNGVQASGMDWLGLYKKGECKQTDYSQDNPYPLPNDVVARHSQNQCYLLTAPIPAYETSGTVRFEYSSFKNAGEYEVRFFSGTSRHGQGVVCRGMGGLAEGFEESATYESCALEAKASSNKITVTSQTSNHGSRKVGSGSVRHIPGLEFQKFAPIGL